MAVQLPSLDESELAAIDAWWRANNYLTVGQIYLQSNPLLREPLTRDDIKPRLLGHWGTSPGPVLHVRAPEPAHQARPGRTRSTSPAPVTAGPPSSRVLPRGHLHRGYPTGHAGRAGHAAAVPAVLRPRRHPQPRLGDDPRLDPRGRRARLRADPRLRRGVRQPRPARRRGRRRRRGRDRPAGGSWKGIKFLNPERDGAVLPVLHLNGYKIANPTVLARKATRSCAA
jgi:xylulose-5-phosphate/fructose-6-phosphate phosphoketolase